MVAEVKSIHQGIKDLRRGLEDGGLAWAHATESAGKYLQTIASTVVEPDIRHLLTSEQLPEVCNFAIQKR